MDYWGCEVLELENEGLRDEISSLREQLYDAEAENEIIRSEYEKQLCEARNKIESLKEQLSNTRAENENLQRKIVHNSFH